MYLKYAIRETVQATRENRIDSIKHLNYNQTKAERRKKQPNKEKVMKKTLKKIMAVALSAALAVAAGAMLTACGEGEKQPAVTGTYMSTNAFRWMNMVPQYNYFTLTYTAQQIQTFDDGTYCVTVNSETYSNVRFGSDVNNKLEYLGYDLDEKGQPTGEQKTLKASPNDRGHSITKYYGTFTSKDEGDGDMTLTLARPTRIVDNKSGDAVTRDTDAWTEAMAKSVTDHNGTQQMDKDGNPLTGVTYIDSLVSADWSVEVFINGTNGSFDQFSFMS